MDKKCLNNTNLLFIQSIKKGYSYTNYLKCLIINKWFYFDNIIIYEYNGRFNEIFRKEILLKNIYHVTTWMR